MLTALFRWPSFLRDAHGKVVGREDGVGVLVEDSRVGEKRQAASPAGWSGQGDVGDPGQPSGPDAGRPGSQVECVGCPRRLPWCRCGALVEVRGCT